jgi:hypothetical protein
MAIDIKQLVIKSNVADDYYENESENNDENSYSHNIKLKHEILKECRRMVIEMLNDKGRR